MKATSMMEISSCNEAEKLPSNLIETKAEATSQHALINITQKPRQYHIDLDPRSLLTISESPRLRTRARSQIPGADEAEVKIIDHGCKKNY
jgi:hypothetical protein